MDGVRVDRDLGHDLADRRQSVTRSQQSEAHRLADLVDELAVGGDAGPGIQPEVDQRCLGIHKHCTNTLVHPCQTALRDASDRLAKLTHHEGGTACCSDTFGLSRPFARTHIAMPNDDPLEKVIHMFSERSFVELSMPTHSLSPPRKRRSRNVLRWLRSAVFRHWLERRAPCQPMGCNAYGTHDRYLSTSLNLDFADRRVLTQL